MFVLFMQRGFCVGVSILLLLKNREYEYLYSTEMWVNFLFISVCQAAEKQQIINQLFFSAWPLTPAVVFAVNRIFSVLNAT